jgi:hypothetical protein
MFDLSDEAVFQIRKNWKPINEFPLLNQLFQDPSVHFCFRGLDFSWKYQGILPNVQAGFNPFNSTVYFCSSSAFSDWFFSGCENLENYIAGENVINELLFALHDYLHIWSYQCVDHLTSGRVTSLITTPTPLTELEKEELIFFHLLSEAVATIGLDYWFLSRNELWRVLSVGTTITGLTATFSERHMDEFRKFNPDFQPFKPQFLNEFTRFYCDGVLNGFDVEALQKSNIVFRWLKHELTYGQTQRNHSSTWINYLFSDLEDYQVSASTTTTVKIPLKYETLLDQVGSLLWEKIKGEKNHFFPSKFPALEKPRFRKKLDPRFSNPLTTLYNLTNDQKLSVFEFMFVASSYSLVGLGPEDIKSIKEKLSQYSEKEPLTLSELRSLLSHCQVLKTIGQEPGEIFILP